MSERRRPRARGTRGEARRVEGLLKSNKKKAVRNGSRLRHGTAASTQRGCQCLKCRVYRAKLTGRPQDPHYPGHLGARPRDG